MIACAHTRIEVQKDSAGNVTSAKVHAVQTTVSVDQNGTKYVKVEQSQNQAADLKDYAVGLTSYSKDAIDKAAEFFGIQDPGSQGSQGSGGTESEIGTSTPSGLQQMQDAINNGMNGIQQNAQNIQNLDKRINWLNTKIDKLQDEVYDMGASMAALAGIHYQHMNQRESQIAGTIGTYKGRQAMAFGLAHQVNDRFQINASATLGRENMANIGASYKF